MKYGIENGKQIRRQLTVNSYNKQFPHCQIAAVCRYALIGVLVGVSNVLYDEMSFGIDADAFRCVRGNVDVAHRPVHGGRRFAPCFATHLRVLT